MSIKRLKKQLISLLKSLKNKIISILFFVIDDNKIIIGLIDLKDLIIARSNQTLSRIMLEDFKFVYADESIEKAIQTVVNYDRNAIPVLDSFDHMIGIVTADDVFDEIIETVESDYQKMALLSDHESSSSVWERSKKDFHG